MPALVNRRHEHFALLRSKDVPLQEAYWTAGYKKDKGHPSRLAARIEVADRIAELRREGYNASWADLPEVISALLEIGHAAKAYQGTPCFKEARLAYLDAARLYQEFRREVGLRREREAASPSEPIAPPAR